MLNKKFTSISLVVLLGLLCFDAVAQFSMSGQVRPRTEYNHGTKTLANKDQDPSAFISQRSRLNLNYGGENYKVGLVLQDVRTWGSQSQLTTDDGLYGVHQAWLDWNFTDNWSVKAGRQELVYDDHRIFGHVGWAQQARSHDLAVFKFKNKLHIGLAYNNDKAGLLSADYTVAKSYKTFQYIWYHIGTKESKVNVSLLALNNGLQAKDDDGNFISNKIRYSQTIGGRLNYKASDKVKVNSNAYVQTGEDVVGKEITAYLFSLDLDFKVSDDLTLSAGFERQSGNNQINQTAGTNTAFNPFYGTNHKFNGLMDYFYVGNHINSVGLQDNFIKAVQKIGKKSKLILFVHNFSAVGRINDGTGNSADSGLGNEVDLVFVQKVNSDVMLKVGYSQMFAENSMEILKGGSTAATSNWAWVMLSVSPKFIK